MDEDLLEATNALTLSPRKDRAALIQVSRFFADCRSKTALSPTASTPQNHIAIHDLAHAAHKRSFAELNERLAAPGNEQSMSKRSKKPKIESRVTRTTSVTASPSSKRLVIPDQSQDHGSNALASIVISDSEDQDTAADEEVDDPTLDEESPDSSAPLQSLARRFTYESPAKSRPLRNVGSSTVKPEPLKRIADLQQPSSSFASSASSSVNSSAIQQHTSASTSTDSAPKRAPKKPKATKKLKHLTIKLRKTIEEAQKAGIEPLDLSKVSATGLRLVNRCPFCAGSFTKSAAAKVKQEHMSLCAPLNGITRSTAAFDTVASDIRSAQKRDEEAKDKARDDRTVFQDVVQDAGIVLHEGRASQIEASLKKRGKDSIIVKKAIKRPAKAPLLISEKHSPDNALGSHTAAISLISAQKANSRARSFADQIFGAKISSTLVESMGSSKSAEADQGKLDVDPTSHPPDIVVPTTPKKAKARALTPLQGGGFDPIEGEIDETHQLPVVSAEQVFASLSASGSPQKSPIKALQKSRERRASKDNDLSFDSEGSELGLGSPNLLTTQQFAPSKLAHRRGASTRKDGPSLFAAETTTRSLLDLVKTHRRSESREVSAELKRKPAEVDEGERAHDAKRCRMVDDDDPMDMQQRKPGLDSKLPSREAVANGDKQASPGAAPNFASAYESDMDIDAQAVEAVLSQSQDQGRSFSGKLQEHDLQSTRNRPASLDQVTHSFDAQASPQLQQTPNTTESVDHFRADAIDEALEGFDTDSIAEDDDEDAQSFLELLEPLEIRTNAPSPPYSLSEPSSEDLDEPNSRNSVYRNHRILDAIGGTSDTIGSRREAIDVGIPPASQARPALRQGLVVSKSDPEAILLTDPGSDSSA
ncbi:hypothetical protein NDA14_004968 [Ustilago hordei]|nr:hypothetical protein NDA14_004968 [Ustilago hordei]UTT94363.1 hypothetical protein NDA17_004478 [Ustilago hordei]